MRLVAKRLAGALVLALAAFAPVPSAAQAPRERVDGVTNFGRVTDRYFRGGKVTPAGVENLAKLGVRTIVDLRDEPSPGEPEACARLGITYYKLPMTGHEAPDPTTVDQILALIGSADAPVYVHCSAGKHRAGTVCAIYRMRVQGWSAERAWAEQQFYGFGAREEHPELYAFAYEAGGGARPADALSAASPPALALAPEPLPQTGSSATAAAAGALSSTARYLPLADVVARAKAKGGAGDVVKVDLEFDLERTVTTWDVTFSSGTEYEFDALSGELLGTKQKTPAKIATLLPLGEGSKGFVEVLRTAEAAGRQAVQEIELKRVKGTPRTVFEVVLVDGTTLYFNAETGALVDAL